ncbi:LpqB family beta-propeller domain-containing protein [Streptomyces jumonjinensis]|uniref:LpqB family beta-propeller domain-containing protein n=1 Tax=Streptomyces jumonjinensis TaxID=1945 RepID=UPI003332BC32
MGADSGRRNRLRFGVLLGGSGVLLAGCASMPTSGDIRAVKASQRADSQVRVEALPPQKGAMPSEVVAGFLEAMTSDDADFATARAYLTPEMAKKWRPQAGTTVLAAAPVPGAAREGGRDNPGIDFPLRGRQIAMVDDRHAYQAITPSKYQKTIHLSRQSGADGKEWRIDSLPEGLVLGASDFQRNYRSVNKYYFATGRPTMVADPVFIRQRMDPVTQAVVALLDGPTTWLEPVVESRFPTGTTLKKGVKSLTFDDQDTLKVPLNEKASGVSTSQCNRMAAQILFTLKGLPSTRVGQVELQRANGTSLCVLDSDQADGYAPDPFATRSGKQYFVDDKSRLAVLPGDAGNKPSNVPGPLGSGELPMSQVAVARDESTAAAVSKDFRHLHVSSITSDGTAASSLVESEGGTPETRLSAPSWDGRGDLWIADRDPERPALLRFEDGSGPPKEVRILQGLGGARIESVKVSADATRIALLLTEGEETTLKIGRVERDGPKGDPVVSIAELRQAAPQMETVTAVSWAGPSRLAVVGKEAGGVQQVRHIQTDGSSSAAAVLPGLNSVRTVAASDDESQPLVAHSESDGIVRLPPGGNWQTVVIKGSSPVYPG